MMTFRFWRACLDLLVAWRRPTIVNTTADAYRVLFALSARK